ncbi:hypothetical protein KC19_3G176400 [Ceratodon purpureus]|uniref:Uncharacterized protein n=1 Tax=Ceratodon purpureus TaxID=3225 RepID=A0A8T0IL51_CERPU|nr:hypothetical protein KC19_3G176400 [Ceratodon purpureus]
MAGEPGGEIHSGDGRGDGEGAVGSGVAAAEEGGREEDVAPCGDGKEDGVGVESGVESGNCERNVETQSGEVGASDGDDVKDAGADGGRVEDRDGGGEVSGEDSSVEEAARASDRNVGGDGALEEDAVGVEAAAGGESGVELAGGAQELPAEGEEPASSGVEDKDAIALQGFDDVDLESTSEAQVEGRVDVGSSEEGVSSVETQSRNTEDGSVSSAVGQGEVSVQGEVQDVDKVGQNPESGSLEEDGSGTETPKLAKRIEITLSESPRLTYVASENSNNLTNTSIELGPRASIRPDSQSAPALDSSADNAGDIQDTSDNVSGLAEPGEFVGQSREIAGVEAKRRLPQAGDEELAEGLIVATEEAMRKNLKSKSFTANNATSKLASGKEAGDSKDDEDDSAQYMSLPQDEHPEASSSEASSPKASSPATSRPPRVPSSTSIASSNPTPEKQLPKTEATVPKGIDLPKVPGGGLVHSQSLDVSTPHRTLTPSLRPTLSYDGASFFLPIQEVKVLKNSLMPDAPLDLLTLIDTVIEGADDIGFTKLAKFVSGEECFSYVEGVASDHVVIARLVVDILIAKMGGVEGLDEKKETTAPRVMLRAGPAVLGSKLLPWLPSKGVDSTSMSPRTRMAKALVLVLQACTRNRAMCSAAGLLRNMLLTAQMIFTQEADIKEGERWDPSLLFEAFEALGSHCLTVLDLREWLRTVARTFVTGKSLDLILTLERSISGEETRGPSHTFEFDGASSGLLGPGESRWPFTNGYTFATWLYVESFADAVSTAAAAAAIAAAASVKSNKTSAMSAAAAASALAGEGTAHMPRLFSFLSLDSLGVEAYFHGQFLVVDCVTGRGKKSSVHFTFPFQLRRWYFIGLEHTCKQGILGKAESELKLYIDGRLCESRPLVFPRPSSLGFCCIGTNPPPAMTGLQKRRLQCPLFAEMGPVYIFKEPIGLDKMTRLCVRGGDALSSFGAGAGVPWFANNEQAMSAAEDSATLDAELGPALHLLYHPKLLVGRSCPDASPTGASGLHRKPAEVLGHVYVAARIRPTETIWAMAEGGPMALLPLTVGAVNRETLQPVCDNAEVSSAAASLSAPIFRMLALTLQHAGNAEEIARSYAPRLLARLLKHLVGVPSLDDYEETEYDQRTEERDEELVVAVIALAQAPRDHVALKVQLYSSLLLDLKLWSTCSYGLQKKLLSTLADMVITEAETMRGANAVQMLLDGCRRCYWLLPEADSIHAFAIRFPGELNALVDELLVVVELLVGSSAYEPSLYTDVCSLVQFVLDCPQPNQVARVLHLIYRLVVQPNTAKAGIFAETLLASGGVEMLLTLLQREAEFGERPSLGESRTFKYRQPGDAGNGVRSEFPGSQQGVLEKTSSNENGPVVESGDVQNADNKKLNYLTTSKFLDVSGLLDQENRQWPLPTEEVVSVARSSVQRGANLGGISISISSDRARNKFRNVDSGDGIMVGIVSLLGALIGRGHLKAMSATLAASQPVPKMVPNPVLGEGFPGASATAVVWLLYALEKAFQAAPNRLMTANVYAALLPAVIRSEVGTVSSEDRLALYDVGHRFEHVQLLLVLLHSLPSAPRQIQLRALQDILLLACTHPENRTLLTTMPEWPDWLLEILISLYQSNSGRGKYISSSEEIEDLVYSFLAIMLEHSMRLKDGWKDVEATIHCAEWLALVGGPAKGEERLRREESLPIIKRKILGNLVDFAASELHLQTQIVAAAAANVAAEGLSPRTARLEAEAAASLSMSLAENALVLLMLVEDHLRLESQFYYSTVSASSESGSGLAAPSFTSVPSRRHSAIGIEVRKPNLDTSASRRLSIASDTVDTGSLSLEILASMADENGQISNAAMERLTASAAAEPFESVRCAFACYGGIGLELADSWKKRSRMWYGVGLPPKGTGLGGGAQGFDTWGSRMERDENGQWVELPLVKKSITMLQALLLDESGPGGGSGGLQGFGGGAGTGSGGAQLQQLLDSDQPFFAMIRMVLVALREEDRGDDSGDSNDSVAKTSSPEVGTGSGRNVKVSDVEKIQELATRRTKSSLLWCVLAPLLTMQLFESRRQRVLVAVCIFYSEVWHAVNDDREVLRKQYLETIVPPFAALLRRWRPLLSGIHEFTDAEGQSPLAVEDRPLAVDAPPLEAALAMITPAWAAAFASPPAAMALAMAGAGVSGGESQHPRSKRGSTSSDARSNRLSITTSFQRPLESQANFQRSQATTPKDKATVKAVALAAARDQERAARVGSVRGLGAVAMATSWQRRTLTDRERTRRGNIAEAMINTWRDYNKGEDFEGINIGESAHSLFGVLPAMVETARRMRILEVNRRSIAAAADEFGTTVGGRVWRSLIRRLQEMGALFGAITNQIGPLERVYWKLDAFENSLRMRKRLKQNYKGAEHQIPMKGYEQSQRTSSDGELPVASAMAKLITVNSTDNDTGEEASRSEDEIEEAGSYSRKEDSNSTTERIHSGIAQTQSSNTAPAPTSPAPSPVPAAPSTPEAKEVLILEMPGVLIQPLKLRGGMFQVTTRRICFMLDDRVQMNESGVAVLIGADGVSEVEAGGEVEGKRKQRKDGSKDRLWPLSLLKEIYTRRYALRKSALELFMADRSNCLFNFGTTEARKKVYKAIVEARPPGLDFIHAATQNPERILKRSQLTEQWANREISNFEYLMQLNTLAGRSFNDITQYPVFPWVLTDYTSLDLDLEDPRIYRDLSKPIGALNPTRLKKYLERYESFEDAVIPKFHYDSHYLSASGALYFMQRVEPYTTIANQINRKTNNADDMFTDIASTWDSVVENIDDVKELVPELFYLPEVLLDDSEMDSEDSQTDIVPGNVKLPPWSSNPVDFVQKHRAALESAYVSDHLHEWIDLIFGYKQQGPEAVAAHNVFFYSTYAGTVDVDKISNPTLRKATRERILYSGQTPFQLLTTPHVKRMPVKSALHLQTVFRNPQATKAYAIPFPDRLNVPAAELRVTQDALVTIDMEVPSCHVAVHRWQANTPDGKGNPFYFQHGRLGAAPSNGALVRMFRGASDPDEDSRYPRVVTLTAPGVRLGTVVAITPDGRYLLTGGHADNSLKVIATDNAHALETALGHCAPITCLGLSPDGSTLVTGSKDATVILWHILSTGNSGVASSTSDTASVVEAAAAVRSTVNIEGSEANASMVEFRRRHVEGPVYVLRGHVDELICCCVNHDLDLVVSSSRSRGVLLHSIARGRFLRRLPVDRADLVALSSEGIIVVFNRFSRVLQTFTENGHLVASKLLPSWEGSISSLVVSKDGLHAVIGTSCGRPLPPDGRWQSKTVPATDAGRNGAPQPRQWDVVGEQPDHSAGMTPNPSDNSGGPKNAESVGASGEQGFTYDPQPAIILLELYTLEVIQKFMLKKGQDITAMALNPDNSNLVVSTANRQLLVFTDPSLSVKVAEQNQRFSGGVNAGGSL